MSGPTGLIFAMKARYNDLVSSPKNAKIDAATDPEALGLAEPSTAFSAGGDPTTAGGTTGGLSTAAGEGAGSSGGSAFGDMGFTIEKASVEAKTRALKAEYSMELAQDLKAIHNLDAESELANILSTEILAEINREVINTINNVAKPGFDGGPFDLKADADGRWAVEKFKSLLFQLEVEANQIAKETRRGKGNFVICSSNVASALAAAGSLDYTPALSANLEVDDTGNTFAGVVNGRMKIYIDPYAPSQDFATVGYRGSNPFDAGLFYCPYVPLTMVRAVDEATFQPKIAFKTRYGMTKNPFVETVQGDSASNAGVGSADSNPYFRTFAVDNINEGE
jgi:hypothetical protein